ncbi:unnamed protein product, partial [Plutella xylostella]
KIAHFTDSLYRYYNKTKVVEISWTRWLESKEEHYHLQQFDLRMNVNLII